MTRKDQIKISNDKIESNTHPYIDRLNAEISAFSSGDLDKYEFLTKKDLKCKPNALDKARFEFYPLGKAFSIGLDKTDQDYQEEGVIKLLKDIRVGLRGGVNRRPNDNRPEDGFDNDGFENDGFDNDGFDNDGFDNDGFDNDGFDNDDDSDDKDDKDDKDDIEKKYKNLLLRYFQLRKNINETKDARSKKLHDFYGFDINGIHKETKDKYDPNGFNINGKHKETNDKYDTYGFDINGKHKDTNDKYDLNGFDIYYTHKDTDYIYDPNGFHINGKHKETKDKYDPNGFDKNGKNKNTGTFFDKRNDIRKDISKNINWLKDKDEFLKLYDEIIKDGEFSEKSKKNLFRQMHLKMF